MNSIAPSILVLAALACILMALALWLFTRARQQEGQKSLLSNLQRNLERNQDATTPPPFPGMAALNTTIGKNSGSSQAEDLLQRIKDFVGFDAWGISPQAFSTLALISIGLAVIAGLYGGMAIAGLVFTAVVLLMCCGIAMRLSRRRAKMLSQLPSFLDNVVRLISIGNSPHAAFQLASNNVPMPLGGALQHVSASLSISPDLGQAMSQLERIWGLPEFGLLAAVFRMSTRYGGRADLVLERVSAYIRDRQSAERELHALSTEVRLSAWILALLPIVVGTLIMVMNKGYLTRMWNDPMGQKLLFVAAGLQILGSFLLYRLARLK